MPTKLTMFRGFDYEPRITILDAQNGNEPYNFNALGGDAVANMVTENLAALLTLRSDTGGGITILNPEGGFCQLNFSRTGLQGIASGSTAKWVFVWIERGGKYYPVGQIEVTLNGDPTTPAS